MERIGNKKGKQIETICKNNGFYIERTSKKQFKALIQGMDFAELNYNGISWNLNVIISNNKKDSLKEIQNILNQ